MYLGLLQAAKKKKEKKFQQQNQNPVSENLKMQGTTCPLVHFPLF